MARYMTQYSIRNEAGKVCRSTSTPDERIPRVYERARCRPWTRLKGKKASATRATVAANARSQRVYFWVQSVYFCFIYGFSWYLYILNDNLAEDRYKVALLRQADHSSPLGACFMTSGGSASRRTLASALKWRMALLALFLSLFLCLGLFVMFFDSCLGGCCVVLPRVAENVIFEWILKDYLFMLILKNAVMIFFSFCVVYFLFLLSREKGRKESNITCQNNPSAVSLCQSRDEKKTLLTWNSKEKKR